MFWLLHVDDSYVICAAYTEWGPPFWTFFQTADVRAGIITGGGGVKIMKFSRRTKNDAENHDAQNIHAFHVVSSNLPHLQRCKIS